MITKFIFSCNIFGGFEVNVDIQKRELLSKEEILKYCVMSLYYKLNDLNLQHLILKLKKKKYYLNVSMDDIVFKKKTPIYIEIIDHQNLIDDI